MKVIVGDFWRYELKSLLVIPTNLGWTRDGMAVMGKGLARDAVTRCPQLTAEYGRFLRKQAGGVRIPWYRFGVGPGYLMVPTKPLDLAEPERSWRAPADLGLIERALASMKETLAYPGVPGAPVVLPLLGCGEGGLYELDVVQLLERCLPEERFTVVVRQQ